MGSHRFDLGILVVCVLFGCSAEPNGGVEGVAGSGGRGGMNSPQGGAGGACSEDPGLGFAGAYGIRSSAPPPGSACPTQHEGFRLCSADPDDPQSFSTHPVLSVCTGGVWDRVEDPSTCKPSYQDCHRPAVIENTCCDEPLYCDRFTGIAGPEGSSWKSGFCDGYRWRTVTHSAATRTATN